MPQTSVLNLSPYFWPEEIGSAPYCRELAQHFSDKGYSVSTLAFRPHYPSIEPFKDWAEGARDHEALGEIRIERVPVNPRGSGGFKDRIRNDLRFLGRALSHAVRGTHRDVNVIIAYVPSVLTLFGAKALKMRSGAAVIAIVHDIESGLASSLNITSSSTVLKVMRLIERFGLNFADNIVVLTDGMKQELRDLGCRKPIEVLPIWSQVAQESPIAPSGTSRVMYSGNFGKKQNLDQLLPLLTHLSANNPNVEIVLRGSGSERARIEQEVARRGIGNTRFLELAPSDEFMTSLQSANIHLVPQALNVANYALPSKLFSIMSAGRPFVCVAEPNSPLDVLTKESGAGICVYPGDETRLCQEVSELLSDPARQQRMGQAGRSFVQQNMNRDTIFDSYEAIIRRLSRAA
ncbi:glycosyltransferase family 4 protein [Ruegeria halocynthiae]|uniref:glycosyltransferase family 4 protein n=1 Tax=Ruegeria halocynthiae TaxID=985054 RepID=UPI0013621A7B|nr:glycosyltransferase family 4 protein [Ruegeria halocynthiae]